MTYLHQVLPLFVLPVALILMLVLAGMWFRRRGRIWASLATLWISGTPCVSSVLSCAWEWRAERIPAAIGSSSRLNTPDTAE